MQKALKKRMVIRMIKFILGLLLGDILGVFSICLIQGGNRRQYILPNSEEDADE